MPPTTDVISQQRRKLIIIRTIIIIIFNVCVIVNIFIIATDIIKPTYYIGVCCMIQNKRFRTEYRIIKNVNKAQLQTYLKVLVYANCRPLDCIFKLAPVCIVDL